LNDWQALGVGLMDMREIARIVASNTATIDLPMWLRSGPYIKIWSWWSELMKYIVYLLTIVLPVKQRTVTR